MVSFLGSLVQPCCGEGGALQTNVTGLCGEHSQCSGHTGFAPVHRCELSPSTLLRLQAALQGAGPALRALPRPEPLRFGFLGTPQRRILGCACVLCLPARAAQAARNLSALSPAGCAMCLFWGADFWLQPSLRMSTIQNLRKSLVRSWKTVCRLVGGAISGAEFAAFPSPGLLPPVGDGPACSWLALLWNLLSPSFWEPAGSA